MGHGFSPQKCNVLSLTRSHTPIRFNYRLKGHILELQDSTKYLGVDLQSSLSWKNHIDRISKKANGMLGFFATQSEVMQRGYQSQRLLYHGEIKSGVLLSSLEPS